MVGRPALGATPAMAPEPTQIAVTGPAARAVPLPSLAEPLSEPTLLDHPQTERPTVPGSGSDAVAPRPAFGTSVRRSDPPPAAPRGRFAAPPPMSAKAPSAGLPLRTWVLLGVTAVVAAGGYVFIDVRDAERAAGEARRSDQAQAVAAQERARDAVAAELTRIAEATEGAESLARDRAEPSLAEADAAARDAADEVEEDDGRLRPEEVAAREAARRRALERAAVTLLTQNDHQRAFAHFERLAERYPDEPWYAATRSILASKLHCEAGGCE
jgi:hypothetical protein